MCGKSVTTVLFCIFEDVLQCVPENVFEASETHRRVTLETLAITLKLLSNCLCD